MSDFDDPFLRDVFQPPPDGDVSGLAHPMEGEGGHSLTSRSPVTSHPSLSGIRRPVAKRPGLQAPLSHSSISMPVIPTREEAPSSPEKPFVRMGATFATAEPMSAGEFLCLIPADVDSEGGFHLGSEMKGSLRAEIRQWVDGLRKRNTTAAGQLRSLSPRDDAIDLLAGRLVEQAAKSRTGVWTAALPTGRQIALVRQDVFKAVGLDQLVRFIHYQAIKVAMANGDAYSQPALDVYEMSHPELLSIGAVR